jgi:hypothetical protein
MHLERVYFNTNGRCKSRLTAKQLKAKQEHNEWLKKRGLHPDQLKAKKTKAPICNDEKMYYRTPNLPPTSDMIGNGFKKQEQQYTGTLITGIATMHKSNAVPVINKKQAEEISRMRRG